MGFSLAYTPSFHKVTYKTHKVDILWFQKNIKKNQSELKIDVRKKATKK